MIVTSKISVEHEGRLVSADGALEGSVLVVRTEDGRDSYEPIRPVPTELQFKIMLSRLLSSDTGDTQSNLEIG